MAHEEPLSPLEQGFCQCVDANRLNMEKFVRDFGSSVQLFMLLEQCRRMSNAQLMFEALVQFKIIAAKQGALSIYHLGNTINALRSQINQCPRTKGKVSTSKIKDSYILFNRYFPHANNTRHAIAHAGEVWKSPNSIEEHRQRKNYSSRGGFSQAGDFFEEMLFEYTYCVSWEGSVFEVHMNLDSINKLNEIITLAYSAFPNTGVSL